MEAHLKCSTNWQPAAHIFQSCLCDLSQLNLHLNFNNKPVHTFKVKFGGQIHAQLFSPRYPQFCHLQYKWEGGLRMQPFAPINVKSQQSSPESWEYKPVFCYGQMYSTGRRIETGKLKQHLQEILRVRRQTEENMPLKLFGCDEFLVLCWSLTGHNLHVIESAVLIPARKVWRKKNVTIIQRYSFLFRKFLFYI